MDEVINRLNQSALILTFSSLKIYINCRMMISQQYSNSDSMHAATQPGVNVFCA